MTRWDKTRGITRQQVFIRDRGMCSYCQEKLTLRTFEVDHVIPRVRGGRNNLSNLVSACWKCNLVKSHLSVSVFQKLLAEKGFEWRERMVSYYLLSANPAYRQMREHDLKKEKEAGNDTRTINTPPVHLGPADTPDSYADDDMARRDQFQAEQEELSRSIDQMLRGGRD